VATLSEERLGTLVGQVTKALDVPPYSAWDRILKASQFPGVSTLAADPLVAIDKDLEPHLSDICAGGRFLLHDAPAPIPHSFGTVHAERM
jgi:hypothetical protein